MNIKSKFYKSMCVSPRSYICLLVASLVTLYSCGISASVEFDEYLSLKDHPKMKGVHLRIKPPKGWLVQEGDGPNVVKRFIGENGAYVILVKDLPTFATRNSYRDHYSDKKAMKKLIDSGMMACSAGGSILDYKLVTVARYPAIRAAYTCSMEKMGITMTIFTLSWSVFIEDKLVSFNGVTTSEQDFLDLTPTHMRTTLYAQFPEQFN